VVQQMFFLLPMLYRVSSQVAMDDGAVLLAPALLGMEQWP